MAYRSSELLRIAQHSPCQLCGLAAGQGDVVAAHIQGYRAHICGKGMGKKTDDCAVAFLCHECHTKMDTYDGFKTPAQYSEFWLWLVYKTYRWMIARDYMQLGPGPGKKEKWSRPRAV